MSQELILATPSYLSLSQILAAVLPGDLLRKFSSKWFGDTCRNHMPTTASHRQNLRALLAYEEAEDIWLALQSDSQHGRHFQQVLKDQPELFQPAPPPLGVKQSLVKRARLLFQEIPTAGSLKSFLAETLSTVEGVLDFEAVCFLPLYKRYLAGMVADRDKNLARLISLTSPLVTWRRAKKYLSQETIARNIDRLAFIPPGSIPALVVLASGTAAVVKEKAQEQWDELQERLGLQGIVAAVAAPFVTIFGFRALLNRAAEGSTAAYVILLAAACLIIGAGYWMWRRRKAAKQEAEAARMRKRQALRKSAAAEREAALEGIEEEQEEETPPAESVSAEPVSASVDVPSGSPVAESKPASSGEKEEAPLQPASSRDEDKPVGPPSSKPKPARNRRKEALPPSPAPTQMTDKPVAPPIPTAKSARSGEKRSPPPLPAPTQSMDKSIDPPIAQGASMATPKAENEPVVERRTRWGVWAVTASLLVAAPSAYYFLLPRWQDSGEAYPIHLGRSESVGARQRVSIHITASTRTTTKNRDKTHNDETSKTESDFQGEVRILKANEKGRATEWEYLVTSCFHFENGTFSQVLPPGQRVVVSVQDGKKQFRTEAGALPAQAEKVLQLIEQNDSSLGDQGEFDPEQSQPVGASWPAQVKTIATELEVAAEQITGKAVLRGTHACEGGPCLDIEMQANVSMSYGKDLPAWAADAAIDFQASESLSHPQSPDAGPGSWTSKTTVTALMRGRPEWSIAQREVQTITDSRVERGPLPALPSESARSSAPVASKPVTQPVTQPAVQPVTQPAVQPVARAVTQPVAQPGETCTKSGWCSRIPVPGVKSLRRIFALSPQEIWASGNDGVVLRSNGVEWTRLATNVTAALPGIFGFNVSQIWAVGGEGTILRYNNAQWVADVIQTAPVDGGISMPFKLTGIWGAQPAAMWAVGKGGVVLRRQRDAWIPGQSGTTNDLFTVIGRSADDVWAVGRKGTIAHYDGASWTLLESGTSRTLYAVYAAGEDDVWVVGERGTILHNDGNGFRPANSGVASIINDLSGVWGSSPRDIWAVGEVGITLHWDGEVWTLVDSGTTASVSDVFALPTGQVWAVGAGGVVLRR